MRPLVSHAQRGLGCAGIVGKGCAGGLEVLPLAVGRLVVAPRGGVRRITCPG